VHDGPVEISMTFFLDRPKNQYRTGKHAAELRPDAQMFPASMPDVDKLARLILDALTGIAWKDDGQVVILTAIKRYADTAPCGITGPGVWITIQGAEPKP
jgi:crossover junction endodeoxyribonuclease RusA